MSKNRIYYAEIGYAIDDNDVRLIRAENKAQVRRHLLSQIDIRPATPDDIIDFSVNGSVNIEDATDTHEEEDND
jgi:hypothetical protein